jgi:stage II sporulation protein M
LKLIVISAAAFVLAIPLGLIVYPLISSRMPALLAAAFGGIMEGSTHLIILKVFMRNTLASVIIMALGATIILPLLVLFLNGLLVGLVFRFAADKGLSVTYLVLGIIPHGIFELPAVFIASALGMRIGLEFFTQKGRRLIAAAEAVREAAAIYLTTVTPLLIIAALMEILVSQKLIR